MHKFIEVIKMVNEIETRAMLHGNIIVGIRGSEHPTLNGKPVLVGDRITDKELGNLRGDFESSPVEKLNFKIGDLEQEIRVMHHQIQAELKRWPRLYSSSTDSEYARETGLWAIDCQPARITGLVKFHFASEHNEVETDAGKLIPIEEYFTEKEIESLCMVV